ncbi:MAG TPA: hypothetical protein VFN02_13275 [Ktedonobacteraceae bacterium]|nr:hypothetical protein [Ktedonobacteraceae bacterium]
MAAGRWARDKTLLVHAPKPLLDIPDIRLLRTSPAVWAVGNAAHCLQHRDLRDGGGGEAQALRYYLPVEGHLLGSRPLEAAEVIEDVRVHCLQGLSEHLPQPRLDGEGGPEQQSRELGVADRLLPAPSILASAYAEPVISDVLEDDFCDLHRNRPLV